MDIFVRSERGRTRHFEIEHDTTAEDLRAMGKIREYVELWYEGELLKPEQGLSSLGMVCGEEVEAKINDRERLLRGCRAVNWRVSRDAAVQAIETGDVNKFRRMLDAEIDIGRKHSKQKTLLHKAVQKGHLEIAHHLLHVVKVDVDEVYIGRNKCGSPHPSTALKMAVKTCDYPMMLLLLDSGADPNWKDAHDTTPLTFLCGVKKGDTLPAIKALLEYGAKMQTPDERRTRTPLSSAVMADRFDVVKLLCENRALGDSRAASQALSLSVYHKKEAIAEYLLREGCGPCMTVDFWENTRRKLMLAERDARHESIEEELLQSFKRTEHRRRPRVRPVKKAREQTLHHESGTFFLQQYFCMTVDFWENTRRKLMLAERDARHESIEEELLQSFKRTEHRRRPRVRPVKKAREQTLHHECATFFLQEYARNLGSHEFFPRYSYLREAQHWLEEMNHERSHGATRVYHAAKVLQYGVPCSLADSSMSYADALRS
eukprot:TRINITY_DN228_c0_g1_i4.p1 TRINITY_DN228_c0_g1~~TRINITY_DN228_c0_g1_i4.p1  ORF type:complete len:489 (+),score=95.55 TRINITY_DN228_c0_g1_i4:57-1523(+)